MAYHIKGSKLVCLKDNYHIWQHWEGGRPMTVLTTVRARARRWTVSEIPFPKLVRTQRNTNIRRGKIPDAFGIPAGRIFYVSKRAHVRVKEDVWSPYLPPYWILPPSLSRFTLSFVT